MVRRSAIPGRGHAYVKSNRHINFLELGQWCRDRQGQIIVCENTSADWMDFKPLIAQRGSMATTTEAIWTNSANMSYSGHQTSMFEL